MKVVKVKISGMTCGGCVDSLKKAFASNHQVKSVDISLDKGEGVFETSLSPREVIKVVESQGFDAMESE